MHTGNPNKFNILQYLIKIHEERGDKILVFCDRPIILHYFSDLLKIPIIDGEIKSEERKKIYEWFKSSNTLNTIFLSRVGDTAIDLPCANVGI
jgi:DNA excision repair protein ERCC-3